MRKLRLLHVLRAALLSGLASLMVVGFLVLGGANSNDAEAFRCSKKWFSRCGVTTTFTEDFALPVSDLGR